jgi:hypothetical protein
MLLAKSSQLSSDRSQERFRGRSRPFGAGIIFEVRDILRHQHFPSSERRQPHVHYEELQPEPIDAFIGLTLSLLSTSYKPRHHHH